MYWTLAIQCLPCLSTYVNNALVHIVKITSLCVLGQQLMQDYQTQHGISEMIIWFKGYPFRIRTCVDKYATGCVPTIIAYWREISDLCMIHQDISVLLQKKMAWKCYSWKERALNLSLTTQFSNDVIWNVHACAFQKEQEGFHSTFLFTLVKSQLFCSNTVYRKQQPYSASWTNKQQLQMLPTCLQMHIWVSVSLRIAEEIVFSCICKGTSAGITWVSRKIFSCSKHQIIATHKTFFV